MTITASSLTHPTTIRHIRQALWLCKIELCKLKRQAAKCRAVQYVKNKKGENYLRVDLAYNGDLCVYAGGQGSKDYSKAVISALQLKEVCNG